ncbi:hypothetical protein [Flavobacterium hercynium]|uniref:Lipoprotein n=1 Tax=Flavobacterium hercynium TaxID=387094 RepID=A0A226HBJ4_9FLAO|nr:hypothetical protein [Flavobacterium hercynium]OXA91643.1 hypothetical protein B0A66_10900 [Flavobacterium hercynium]SMP27666.1 YD repeat-containing protein [Flavobacterium hercynium]
MKKILLLIITLLSCSCKTGLIQNDLKNNFFERFPIESWNTEFVDFKTSDRSQYYIYKGLEFYPTGSAQYWEIYVYPQKDQFYTVVYQYDKKSYKIRRKGKVFGWDPYTETFKIGIWYEYNEQGKLIKEIDEDKKFGKFSYNELLQFLDKEKLISLKKGLKDDVNRRNKMVGSFYSSETSDKKLWSVYVHTGLSYTIETPDNQIGETRTQPGKRYFIDGNTGEVIKRTEETLEYYKEIGFN